MCVMSEGHTHSFMTIHEIAEVKLLFEKLKKSKIVFRAEFQTNFPIERKLENSSLIASRL